MKDEIAAAVVFITQLVKKNSGLRKDRQTDRLEKFQNHLTAHLLERFKDHWYQNVPSKGQGYRCIRINSTEPVDPVLEHAAIHSGMKYMDLGLPNELTLWVDPSEVCCRLGENRGSFCTVALFQDGSSENKVKNVDVDQILARHYEQQQAQHAKFVHATSTRWNQKEPAARVSPPATSYAQYPAVEYTWDMSVGNGYQRNTDYHGNGGYGTDPNMWGQNWGQSSGQLSPNSNSEYSGSHPTSSHTSHQKTFSNHPADRSRWSKSGEVKA